MKKYILITALIGLGALGASFSSTSTLPIRHAREVGEKVELRVSWWGCPTLDDAEKAEKLFQEDPQTAEVFVRVVTCLAMGDGRQGVVEKQNSWHEYSCFRPGGSILCYWVPSSVLRRG